MGFPDRVEFLAALARDRDGPLRALQEHLDRVPEHGEKWIPR